MGGMGAYRAQKRLSLQDNFLENNLPTSMLFICKPANPEFITPTKSLSNSHTPS